MGTGNICIARQRPDKAYKVSNVFRAIHYGEYGAKYRRRLQQTLCMGCLLCIHLPLTYLTRETVLKASTINHHGHMANILCASVERLSLLLVLKLVVEAIGQTMLEETVETRLFVQYNMVRRGSYGYQSPAS
jgi:hypothetical protein